MTDEELRAAFRTMRVESEPLPVESEPLPPADKPLSTVEWLRVRAAMIEGWEPDHEKELAAETLKAAELAALEQDAARQRANASKPRPASRHPRRDEAMAMADGIMADEPGFRAVDVAVRVAADLDGDDVPHYETIARWIRSNKTHNANRLASVGLERSALRKGQQLRRS